MEAIPAGGMVFAIHFKIITESIFMPEWLLELIRCPQTGEGLRLADRELMANVNRLAQDGKLFDTMGRTISPFSSQGLINENGNWLYRIDDDTPSLLADEAINLKLTDLRKA